MQQTYPNSIFIRAQGGFGDHLMTTAVVEAIRKEYPSMRIFVLAQRPEIFENNPHVSQCYDLRKMYETNRSLYDMSIEIKHRAAYRAKTNQPHLIDDIYDKLPLEISRRQYRPMIYLTVKERKYKKRKLERLRRPLVAIAPSGKKRSKIPNKIYPVDKWRQVVSLLGEKGVEIIQLGHKSEGPLLRDARDWRNLGYRRTASVLLRCTAVITHVGGIMHLAAACGVPCVALYAGVEHPNVTGYPQHCNLYVDLDCAPCWRADICPTRECMDILCPEKIVAETMNLLNSTVIKPLVSQDTV